MKWTKWMIVLREEVLTFVLVIKVKQKTVTT